ncbi:unnamed protein product [Spirodela intermedia]|uniref:Uncharacterized protein n=1 Tax=Spirodela intermedia TaxID=51605 RepID=A0A7I8IN03_SPIIN|nr:unnamed protein product [Spirodela intermedia]CAA6659344.1 unnamed protein product [Spirodela intermedia]
MVVAGVALLVAFQERLLYVPVLPGLSKSYPMTPARLRLKYEDVWLRASDGVRLHAWFIRQSSKRSGPTILFFQENAGNIAHRLEYIRIMIAKLRCNVFMLSYRGYGASDGYPSQPGITRDARCEAALDHLLQRADIDTSRIVVFGRSLGGAVGSVLVRDNPIRTHSPLFQTWLQSCSFPKVAYRRLWVKGPRILNYFVRSPWSTIDVIGQATRKGQCTFVDFPAGRHMDTWLSGGDRYWVVIQLFLSQHAPAEGEPACSRGMNDDDGMAIPLSSSVPIAMILDYTNNI